MNLSSYGKIYAIGHRELKQLFDGPVVVQEKIDGSQFSFGVSNAELFCRSRGQQIVLDAPGMFAAAVATATSLYNRGLLVEGHIYRCEYLSKPKHNALTYGRVPKGNLVLFDIELPGQNFLCPVAGDLIKVAEAFGIDVTPVFSGCAIDSFSVEPTLRSFLERESFLGGCKVEGVVVKNYNKFGEDKKILVGKFVSEAFKEVHRHEWRKANPTNKDIVGEIIADYRTSPRWFKAIQHLKEAGQITETPKDIGPLIREIQGDVLEECAEEIKERLFKHFSKEISRGVVAGFPEFYKAKIGIVSANSETQELATPCETSNS